QRQLLLLVGHLRQLILVDLVLLLAAAAQLDGIRADLDAVGLLVEVEHHPVVHAALRRHVLRRLQRRGDGGGVAAQGGLGERADREEPERHHRADDAEHDQHLEQGDALLERPPLCRPGGHAALAGGYSSFFLFLPHDFTSSSVPSLPSAPLDRTPKPFGTPSGALSPHTTMYSLPHGSSVSSWLVYLASSARVGQLLPALLSIHEV